MIHLQNLPDVKNYSKVEVYLHNEKIPCVELTGKVETVDWDNFRIAIKTASDYAVFKAEDVVAIRFE